jgi:hypothetical protein
VRFGASAIENGPFPGPIGYRVENTHPPLPAGSTVVFQSQLPDLYLDRITFSLLLGGEELYGLISRSLGCTRRLLV